MCQLIIKRLKQETTASISGAAACLDAEVPVVPLERINWPQYPYRPRVRFRIGHVQTEIWLKFEVAEDRIRAQETRLHGEVSKDSCVEFFISFDGASYYNFEFNCIGTPHIAYGPGRQERQFVQQQLLGGLSTYSSLGQLPFEETCGDFEWNLMIRIPTTCFAFDKISSLSGMHATANFYKVGRGISVPHYVTWSPINTPEPDYHRPEFFGGVYFE